VSGGYSYSKYSLSKYSFQVMSVFFETDESLTSSDIDKRLKPSWSEKTLHSILSNLVAKGYIEIDGEKKIGRYTFRTYRKKISIEDYNAKIVMETYSKAGQEINIKRFISALTDVYSKEVNEEVRRRFLGEKDE